MVRVVVMVGLGRKLLVDVRVLVSVVILDLKTVWAGVFGLGWPLIPLVSAVRLFPVVSVCVVPSTL